MLLSHGSRHFAFQTNFDNFDDPVSSMTDWRILERGGGERQGGAGCFLNFGDTPLPNEAKLLGFVPNVPLPKDRSTFAGALENINLKPLDLPPPRPCTLPNI